MISSHKLIEKKVYAEGTRIRLTFTNPALPKKKIHLLLSRQAAEELETTIRSMLVAMDEQVKKGEALYPDEHPILGLPDRERLLR